MINLYVVVNNYLFTQGINSVVDQFYKNKIKLLQAGIEYKGVIDQKKFYHEIPKRENGTPKQVNTTVKKSKLYKSYFGNVISIFLHSILVGKKVAENVYKVTSDSENTIYIFQDVFAAYYALKKYKMKNIIFMTHTYEDELEQLLMNYPEIKERKFEAYIRYIYGFVYDNCYKSIAICNKAKEWIKKNHKNLNVEVLYNSVIDCATNHKLKEHEKVNIAMASSIGIRKGFDMLKNVFGDIPYEILEKCHFHIYGNGDYLDTLKNYCRSNHIDNVTFYGRVEKPYLNYNDMDAYLMISRSETLPMSIIEAMMYSLPIFATNVGAISEMIDEGRNGFLYEPNEKAIRKAIEDILKNKNLLCEMGKESRKIYLDKFGEEKWVERLTLILKDDIYD